MRTFGIILLGLLGAAALVVYSAAYIVTQTEQAIVLRFGAPQDVKNEYKLDAEGKIVNGAGLYFKVPFIETVDYFDKRILDLDTSPQEVIASDQKRLVVDAFARYRITDPLEFYKTVRSEVIARQRLNDLMGAAIRAALGGATFQDVVRDRRDELMIQIRDRVNGEATKLGINVVDVRIKRADLPEENSEAIFGRMTTERQQEAAEIRARGNEAANRIRATADREATVIKAEATKTSELLRGEGDAERNKIFADAFNKDPDFFAFYRSMQAYEKGLASSDTRLVISPNSQFFQYFGNANGKPANAGQ
ncbi:MAG: protease modulator HflC [Pseudomonadota bacterium]